MKSRIDVTIDKIRTDDANSQQPTHDASVRCKLREKQNSFMSSNFVKKDVKDNK